ncbi:Uncharacterised protein [Porphyromonas endodontalis]|nr:Uncharacterised protein [Porphyromonas endodontalis]
MFYWLEKLQKNPIGRKFVIDFKVFEGTIKYSALVFL